MASHYMPLTFTTPNLGLLASSYIIKFKKGLVQKRDKENGSWVVMSLPKKGTKAQSGY